jgi:hypothetical protein
MKRVSAVSFSIFAFIAFSLTAFQNCGKPFEVASTFEANFSSGAAAPSLKLIESPKSLENQTTAHFVFGFEGPHSNLIKSIECKMDDQQSVDCSNGQFTVGSLSNGAHSFEIKIYGSSGDSAKYPAYVWNVDASLPVINVTEKPADYSSDRTPTFVFTNADAESGVAKVECQLGTAAYTECTSPVELADLPQTPAEFRIRITDNAGNSAVSETKWLPDYAAPSIIINSAPTGAYPSRDGVVLFSSVETGSGVQSYICALDTNRPAPCSSPYALTGMSDGSHTLRITANDRAGNSMPNLMMWSVDTTAPVLSLSGNVGAFTNSTSATFTFSGTDDGVPISGFQCGLTGNILGGRPTYTACTSPYTINGISEGFHSFIIQVTDLAGNVSSKAVSFVVDTGAPYVAVSQALDATDQRSATFTFQALDDRSGIASVQCSLNGSQYAPCTSPVSATGLAVGTTTLSVRAIDLAGNAATQSASIEIVRSITLANSVNVLTAIDLREQNGFLYTGLEVGNIANRTTPVFTKYTPYTGFPHYTGLAGSTLTQSSASNFYTYDLSDPASPKNTAFGSLNGFPSGTSPQFTRSMKVANGILYGCWSDYNTQTSQVRIGVWNVSGASPTPIAETFVGEGPSVINPAFPDGINDCTVDGDTVYVRRSGTILAYPVSANGIGTPQTYNVGHVIGDSIVGGTIVGFNMNMQKYPFQLDIVDTTGAKATTSIKTPTPAGNVSLHDRYLAVLISGRGSGNELRVYDMSYVAGPKLIALAPADYMTDMVIKYPYIYGLTINNTMSIYQVQ